MTYHIYNGDKIVNEIINGIHIIKSKYRSEELSEDLEEYKNKIITSMNHEAKNIEVRSVIKQRINTYRADELECPDIRRWWSQMEYINIARSIPAIEEFLKEHYGKNYTAFTNKMTTYKSILDDIKYRMDIIVNNHYTVTNPEQKKFIHETESKIARIPLINEEAKKVGLLLDLFTNMGDMTVPSTTLQNARGKFRKVEYEQTDKRDTAREYLNIGGGE